MHLLWHAGVPDRGQGRRRLRRVHLSYLPHSGDVLADVGDAVAGYDATPGSLHFPADQPLPDDLVRALVEAKMRRVGLL